jgi:hypothetical protein
VRESLPPIPIGLRRQKIAHHESHSLPPRKPRIKLSNPPEKMKHVTRLRGIPPIHKIRIHPDLPQRFHRINRLNLLAPMRQY